jgi:hypothetical protein
MVWAFPYHPPSSWVSQNQPDRRKRAPRNKKWFLEATLAGRENTLDSHGLDWT